MEFAGAGRRFRRPLLVGPQYTLSRATERGEGYGVDLRTAGSTNRTLVVRTGRSHCLTYLTPAQERRDIQIVNVDCLWDELLRSNRLFLRLFNVQRKLTCLLLGGLRLSQPSQTC